MLKLNNKGGIYINIVYTTELDISGFGGIETIFPQETSHLAKQGNRIISLCLEPKREQRLIKNKNIEYHFFPKDLQTFPNFIKWPIFWMWEFFLLFKILLQENITSIQSFSVTDALPVSFLKVFFNFKQVIRINGPMTYELLNFIKNKKFYHKIYSKLFMIVEFVTYCTATILIPVSEFEKDNVLSYNIDIKKIHMIRNAIDLDKYKPLKRKEENTFIIMFVGRLVEKNGPLVLLNSTPFIKSYQRKIEIHFVGDGELKNDIKKYHNTTIHKIKMWGYRSNIEQILPLANLYVSHVSGKVDGIGQTVMEAMACGCPVIIGRDSITERIFKKSKWMRLIKKDNPKGLGEEINGLIFDEEKLKQLSINSRNFAITNFSLKKQLETINKFLTN